LTKNEVQTKKLAYVDIDEKPEHNEELELTDIYKRGAEQITV